MGKKQELISGLLTIISRLPDYGLIRTECFLDSLVTKLKNPDVALTSVQMDFYLLPITFEMEMEVLHLSHLLHMKESWKELEIAKKKELIGNRPEIWDSLENRTDPLELGNIIVEKVNNEKDPVSRTLLQCLNIIILYETGQANYSNYVNSMLRYRKGAVQNDANTIIQLALTLSLAHKRKEYQHTLIGKKFCRSEMCRIRDGIAHSRINILPDGSLHVWDVIPKMDERVFDQTFTYNELTAMFNDFYDRLVLLDTWTYFNIVRNIMFGPNATKYLT